MRVRAVLSVMCCVLLAACADSPTAPDGQFAGTWSGAIVDGAVGSGTARLILAQTGAGVSGTFTTTFTNAALNQAGSVSGTAAGSSASVFLTPGSGIVCPPGVTLSGSMGASLTATSGKLSGSYSVLGCSGAVTGTLELSRQ